MGGQITLEGRKRPTGGSAQLLTPRSKAQVSHIRISDTPRGHSIPIALVTPLTPNAVQSINVRHHVLHRYRPRLTLTHRSPLVSPIEPPHSSSAELTEDDLLGQLSTMPVERKTYKLQRRVRRVFEEVDRDAEPQVILPNSARRESLAAAVELKRDPVSNYRTSILSMEPLRIPGLKKRPKPLQLVPVPETPAKTGWSSLLERGNR